MLISNIFLDARLELFELPDEDCNGLFQMLSLFVLSLAKNQEIQRDTKIDSNLGALYSSGQIANVKLSPAERYDSRLDFHYHMVCSNCKKVFDAPLSYHPEYDDQITKDTGFHIKRHRALFEGICSECYKNDEILN